MEIRLETRRANDAFAVLEGVDGNMVSGHTGTSLRTVVRSGLIGCAAFWAVVMSVPEASGQIPIRYVEGKVLLDSKPVAIKRAKSYPWITKQPIMKNGQVLETDRGRAELGPDVGMFLDDHNRFFLDEHTSVKVLSDRRFEGVVEIRSGSAIVEVAGFVGKPAGDTIRYKEATIVLEKAGEYQIDADRGRFRIYRGEATVSYGVALDCDVAGICRLVVNPQRAKTVQAHKGEQIELGDELPVTTVDAKETSPFLGWVKRRLAAPQSNPLPPCWNADPPGPSLNGCRSSQ